jgi:hypothetical protein
MVWGPEDEDDADDDQGSKEGEGAHSADQPPPKAASPSIRDLRDLHRRLPDYRLVMPGGDLGLPDEPEPTAPQGEPIGVFLLELGRDPSSGFGRVPERQPDALRLALCRQNLRSVSRRSGLPVRLIEHFARGGSISPASLLLLLAALHPRRPRREQLRTWLHEGGNATRAAAALGLRTADIHAVAEGRVDLCRGQWRRVAALVGGTRC